MVDVWDCQKSPDQASNFGIQATAAERPRLMPGVIWARRAPCLDDSRRAEYCRGDLTRSNG